MQRALKEKFCTQDPIRGEIEYLITKAFGQSFANSSVRPKRFVGKRVLVVGLGNTGADIAMDLVGHAREVYVSHRQGTYIVSISLAFLPFQLLFYVSVLHLFLCF